ncbi:hypothetical protein AAHE18_01G210000 [Arachis hypogaea]
MDHYENDFESAMLKNTSAYYSQKASKWILEDSCPDYMFKAEECLNQEKDRVAHYLHSSSEPKLLEKVQHELLSVYANQLLQKEHSGCHALLRDGKDFDRKVIELRDKYLSYVNDCFQNHTLFQRALESFEVFCNKGVAGSSSTELLATFSDDNILKDLGTLLANRLPT